MTDLLPASFRGVSFAVQSNATEGGRRLVAHQYPGRDGFNLEDMGRKGRRYRISGFIVSDSAIYGGGDVALQRQAILAAAELAGTGILIHPTLGILTVGCESCSVGDDLDAGTRAAIEFSFLEQTIQNVLGISTSTIAAITSAALLVDAAASTAFSAANPPGAAAASASAQWSAAVTASGQDATALANLASQLPGPYGRYFAGGNAGYLSPASGGIYSGDVTVSSLVGDAVTARAAIASASSTVASDLSVFTSTMGGQVASDVQALVATLLAACSDPTDALRILTGLVSTTPTGQTAIDDLYRRATVVASVRAGATYQPSSQNDAASVQAQLTGLLDDEIEVAGDEGDDGSYQALKGLRVAVVADLRARGASLAPLKSYSFNTNLPALALAKRLYGDAARSDQLVAEADPVSPLFMPTQFEALAS